MLADAHDVAVGGAGPRQRALDAHALQPLLYVRHRFGIREVGEGDCALGGPALHAPLLRSLAHHVESLLLRPQHDVGLDFALGRTRRLGQGCQRAAEVIRGVRALVRKDTNVARSVLNLNAVIADTIRLVSSDIVLRESVVTTEMDHNLPQVEAAPVQIQQVLLNLIMNALDSVETLPPAERRIIVSTRSLEGEKIEVSVRDFGPGLPKDRPEKVFDHFFSTKQTGMGMGLTIVRSIIETHGGTITAENAPEGGARFVFRLPAVRRDLNSQAA